MAENEFRKVKTGDTICQIKPNNDYSDVFVCVVANEEIFVLARPKIKLLGETDKKTGKTDSVEIIGYNRENCKVYDNNEDTLKKYYFEIAE